ncbi:hypothetical protein E3N88_32516 [Mikania micrantha]|uniref:Uncharacterized protein n=1 Tax=Mikania micrantha TaxID=192012 RepID=A0A5N6M995_9ASTR|nr:hypothetical protein E3N88_32516 [Mikania micrantha]
MGSPIHVDNQLIFQQPGDEEQEDADEGIEDTYEELQGKYDTESEDDFILLQSSEQYHIVVYQGFSNDPTEDYDKAVEFRDCELPDYDDADHTDIWNLNDNQICVSMFFKTKAEVVCIIHQRNVA